ncbi:MAG: hypothetical protein JWN85_2690, partial [Gammaproteobacteria bacterium]|nr:hypothetical protein [Gammaproteobacteria bacterium]
FLGISLAVVALLIFVFMSLWNQLVPSLFSGPSVSFWQAAGLLVLTRILVGGFRGHGGPPWGARRRHWKSQMWRERWESMSPEDRERLRERFKHRCGWGLPGEMAEPPKP